MKTKDQYRDIVVLEKKLEGLSPQESRVFLKREGILDKEGRLTEYGEHILGRMASKITSQAE